MHFVLQHCFRTAIKGASINNKKNRCPDCPFADGCLQQDNSYDTRDRPAEILITASRRHAMTSALIRGGRRENGAPRQSEMNSSAAAALKWSAARRTTVAGSEQDATVVADRSPFEFSPGGESTKQSACRNPIVSRYTLNYAKLDLLFCEARPAMSPRSAELDSQTTTHSTAQYR